MTPTDMNDLILTTIAEIADKRPMNTTVFVQHITKMLDPHNEDIAGEVRKTSNWLFQNAPLVERLDRP